MKKLKKGFAIAVAAGVLTGAGLGTQVSALAVEADPAPETSTSTVTGTPAPVLDTGKVVVGDPANFATLPTAAKDKTLVIHKHDGKGTDSLEPQNGTEQTNKNFGDEVNGAEFTIRKLTDYDLTTVLGWQNLQERLDAFPGDAVKAVEGDPATSYAALSLGAENKAVTANGKVTFSNLEPGAYYVRETKVPDNYVARTRPFIVTVPMTDPVNHNTWVNTVHVYAKNDVKEDQKTVQDSTAEIFGKKAEYKIATQVQTDAKLEKYDQFVFTDFFPQARLEFVDAQNQTVTNPDDIVTGTFGSDAVTGGDVVVTIGAEQQKGKTAAENTYSGGIDLDPANDWVFAPYDAGNPPTVPASGTKLDEGRVVIKLTPAGLDKLNNVNYDKKYVTVKLKMKVKEDTAGLKVKFDNKFDVTTSREKTPDTPPPVTPPNTPPSSPPSYYGNVDIFKTGSDHKRLDGAEFDLYSCTKTDTGYSLPNQSPTSTKLNTAPIRADDQDGTAEIKGLLANDFRNGVAIAKPTTAYCLVETKAPVKADGTSYELLSEPIGFQVKKDEINQIIHTGEIVNTKKNGGFELPLTGGKGVFALLLAGAAFLILGRGYSVYAGRRNKA